MFSIKRGLLYLQKPQVDTDEELFGLTFIIKHVYK